MNFQLWRQDDHGQRFLVGSFADLAAAELRLAQLTRHPHKQCYWIDPGPKAPGLDTIRTALASHTPSIGETTRFPDHRRAAVALLLRATGSTPELLYLQRASHEGDPWSGDIGFPGGHVDSDDRDARAACERETREEIGLDLAAAEPLGRLDDIAGAHLPIIVSCFVYMVPPEVRPRLNHEVVETFWVPLPQLLDPQRQRCMPVQFRGETLQRPAIDLLGPGRPVLWGITYRLTVQFLGLCGQELVDTPLP